MTSCQKLYTSFLPHSSLLPSFHSTHLLFRSQFPSEVKCLPNLPSFHPSIHSVSIPFKREGLPEPNREDRDDDKPEAFLFPSNGKDFQNRWNTHSPDFRINVSIPFKREGLPEPLTGKYPERIYMKFLFPSNGKDFQNLHDPRTNPLDGDNGFYSLQTGRTSRTGQKAIRGIS